MRRGAAPPRRRLPSGRSQVRGPSACPTPTRPAISSEVTQPTVSFKAKALTGGTRFELRRLPSRRGPASYGRTPKSSTTAFLQGAVQSRSTQPTVSFRAKTLTGGTRLKCAVLRRARRACLVYGRTPRSSTTAFLKAQCSPATSSEVNATDSEFQSAHWRHTDGRPAHTALLNTCRTVLLRVATSPAAASSRPRSLRSGTPASPRRRAAPSSPAAAALLHRAARRARRAPWC